MKGFFLCLVFLSILLPAAYSKGKNSGDMILIKGEKFLMGDPDGNDKSEERNGFPVMLPSVKEVFVADFYISKYEATIDEFADFIKETKYKPLSESLGCYVLKGGKWFQLKKYNWNKPGYPVKGRYPVSGINLNDIVEFCNYLSRKDALKPCYSYEEGSLKFDAAANGYRLPTEQEWEFAARGGKAGVRKLSVDPAVPAENLADKTFMNLTKMTGGVPEYNDKYAYAAPVGSLAPNGFGIHDMGGNLWEITATSFYKDSDDYLVLKGGGWFTPLDFGNEALYLSFRTGVRAYGLYSDVGFRVARNAK